MVPVFRSLEQISTGHTVFERDQVLTHEQLNSLAGYADDQARLTRVRLLGIGVVCGLRPSLARDELRVSRGVGVTSDGDLLHLDADAVFDRFRPYDETFPAYPPLYAGGDVEGEMLPAFELVARGAPDDRARPLSEFAAASGMQLADATAVLVMESYVRDDDLCSGTDCDNLGREAVNTPRLLLLRRTQAGALREEIPTPGAVFEKLEELTADRPALSSSIETVAGLANAYRSACANTHARLEAALPRLAAEAGGVLGDAVPAGAARDWTGRLASLRERFRSTHLGIQYYYDFLRDVVDTHNELVELLFADATTCAPPVDAFPKHLLLGDLAPGADPDANRTGFYPSPLAGRDGGALEHARFLARKLDALLGAFRVDDSARAPVRITPSAFDDRPLEERAIPFYYPPDGGVPVHRFWSYRRSRQGREALSYAYHAQAYGAKGAAADPLGSQIGRFPFFRVEGHVGRPVAEAAEAIEAQVRSRNLPFAVRSVLLGREPRKIVKRPGGRFTDLHHLHHLLRRDLARQLDEVQRFSGGFRVRVDDAVTEKVVDDSSAGQGVSLRQVAQDSDRNVKANVASAAAPLSAGYLQYRSAGSWKPQVNSLLRTAGQFKSQLGPVVKTDFNTPFDTLIGSRQLEWLPWLDTILEAREEKEDEKLLFSRFVVEHPGVEHFAGVCRGGTFVLAYDEDGTVVADFMLPYHAPEPLEPEPLEPELADPGVRPPYVVDEGIKILPPVGKILDERILHFEKNVVDPRINEKLGAQTQYLDVIKDSYLNVLKDSLGVIKQTDVRGGDKLSGGFADPNLGLMVEESHLKKQRLENLRQQSKRPDLPEEQKQFYERQVTVAEEDLAQTTRRITDYVSDAGIEVKAGSEGYRAVLEISDNMGKISQAEILDATKSNLGAAMDRTKNDSLKMVLGGMLRF